MVSANVSGRGTPNVSGRDTPISQADSQMEGPEERRAVPDLPVTVQKTNREDVTDRFGKFDIKQELESESTFQFVCRIRDGVSVEKKRSQMFVVVDGHHSLFIFKTSIFPRSARVRRSSRNEAPPHIPEHCPFSMSTKHLHIIFHTFIPSLPPSTHTSDPRHRYISTGRQTDTQSSPHLRFTCPTTSIYTPHHLIDAL